MGCIIMDILYTWSTGARGYGGGVGGGYGAIVGYRGIVGLGYVSISPTPGTNPWFPPTPPGYRIRITLLYLGMYPGVLRGGALGGHGVYPRV